MKKFIAAWVITVLFLPVSVTAEELIITILEDFPPYQYMENNQPTGIDVEIAREVCKNLDIKLKFEAVPWKRALKYAEDGNVSGLVAALRTEEREKFLYYTSEPVHIQKNVVISGKESNIKIAALDDLKGKEVGVLAGFSYGAEIDSLQGLKKTVCNDQQEMIRMLDRGRINVALGSDGPFWFNCKRFGFKDHFEVVYVINELPAYTVFSKKGNGEKGEMLAEKFSKEIRRLRESGWEKQVIDKYR